MTQSSPLKPVHSKRGASSYYRWKACPGSIRQTAGLESPESEYAKEGTRHHEIAANILLMKANGPSHQTDPDSMAAVMTYVDYILNLQKTATWVKIEHRFDLTLYFEDLYGTADAVLYFEKEKKLVVVDYKHGQGIPVEAENNSQLLYYALGAIHDLKVKVDTVDIVVVQPRCYHVDGPIRSWTTDIISIMDFVADLITDAKKTEEPNAPLVPGDHCRFCAAQAVNCPAVKEKSLALAKQVFSPTLTYDPKKLAETLNMLPAMESFIKSVREFAYREAQSGRVPPGFKLVPKRAHRKWREEYKSDYLARELALKQPDVVDVSLKSPAQIEKLLVKEHKGLLEKFIIQESTGLTLAPVSDEREQVSTKAENVFTVLT